MMVAYVFVEQCLMGKQFHVVMRIAHMASSTHHACLLLMWQSLRSGTALTAQDYSNSRDIQGSKLQARGKAKHQSQLCLLKLLCVMLFVSAK